MWITLCKRIAKGLILNPFLLVGIPVGNIIGQVVPDRLSSPSSYDERSKNNKRRPAKLQANKKG
jgi:hypothetical protein